MLNPYEVLGVGEDATPLEIKRAYRKLAKKTHPDAGGSREAFQAVNAAYAVLSDPDKRSHYDRTGEIKDDEPDNAIEIIVSMFNSILAEDVPLYVDYVKLMKKTLKQTVTRLNEQVEVYKTKRNRYEKLIIRFKAKKKEGSNIFKGVLTSKIENLDADIERVSKSVIDTDRAAELLEGYMFLADEEPKVVSPFMWNYKDE